MTSVLQAVDALPLSLSHQLERFTAAETARGLSAPALRWIREFGETVPLPGAGNTAQRWGFLTALAEIDLTAARAVEAHLDALAILAEAGINPGDLERLGIPTDACWGVFAAEGPGPGLTAVPTDHGWQLLGVKPWCSLADRLDAALVTATVAGGRRLFAVALDGLTTVDQSQPWVSRGLTDIPSGPVIFDAAPAIPIGVTRWYLDRPGFAWGGIGVAACWYGGAVGLARKVLDRSRTAPNDELLSLHLGAIDLALAGARWALNHAAGEVDSGKAEPALLAARVRAIVADAAEECLLRVGHALGPALLTQDEDHARRVADLTVYVRQHHAERDLVALAGPVRESTPSW